MEQLKGKHILLISPEPWNHLFVSKHHYALHLAKRGNQVFFLNPPSNRMEVSQSEFKGLQIIDYKGFITGMAYWPAILRHWHLRKVFQTIETLSGVKFDIIWSFDNSVFYDMMALRSDIFKISHIVDRNQDFQTHRAAIGADLCIGVIPAIVDRLKKANPNSHLMTHGVQEFPEHPNKVSLPGSNNMKVLYTGNLAMLHIDWTMITEAVDLCDEADFIFLGSDEGPNNPVKDDLAERSNTHFIDKVKSDQILSYLKAADLLIVAYSKAYYRNYASPHKLVEYLASGRPIVATHIADMEGLGLVEMCDENEWPDLVHKVLSNLESYNSIEAVNKRKNYAREHTYDKQIEKIEKIIKSISV